MFTQELADAICERLATGEPLAQICRDDGMPSDRAVRYWADPKSKDYKGDDFASAIAHARARGFDAIAEGCLEIADDARNDWMERNAGGEDAPAGYVLNGDHVQRSKLRIDTRLKLLAKWDPKRYGERTVLAGDPEAPLQHNVAGKVALDFDAIRSKLEPPTADA